MKLEYGDGRLGVMLDARTRTWVCVSQSAPLDPKYGGTQYYCSMSCKSGAWRLPDRPYLVKHNTYHTRHLDRVCAEMAIDSGPLVPVDAGNIDWELPILVGVWELGCQVRVQMRSLDTNPACDEGMGEEYVLGSIDILDTDSTKVPSVIRPHTCAVYAHTPPPYKWRKVAWKLARRMWSAKAAARGPSKGAVVCGIEWRDGHWEASDYMGLVTHVFNSVELLAWLRTEPDQQGLGLYDPCEGTDHCVIVDSCNNMWVFDASGLFMSKDRKVDWTQAKPRLL
jgi:hypothetical protein